MDALDRKFTSLVNKWKQELAIAKPPPIPEFRPLVVKAHPRQAELDAWRNLPSWKPGNEATGD